MTPKQRKIESLIHELWRQHPRCDIVSTMNPCECGRGAVRGTGSCIQCVAEKLNTLVGKARGDYYHGLVIAIRQAEAEMLNGKPLPEPEMAVVYSGKGTRALEAIAESPKE